MNCPHCNSADTLFLGNQGRKHPYGLWGCYGCYKGFYEVDGKAYKVLPK